MSYPNPIPPMTEEERAAFRSFLLRRYVLSILALVLGIAGAVLLLRRGVAFLRQTGSFYHIAHGVSSQFFRYFKMSFRKLSPAISACTPRYSATVAARSA